MRPALVTLYKSFQNGRQFNTIFLQFVIIIIIILILGRQQCARYSILTNELVYALVVGGRNDVEGPITDIATDIDLRVAT